MNRPPLRLGASLSSSSFLLASALALASFACKPQGADANKGGASTASSGAGASASAGGSGMGTRIPANTVVAEWKGGKMTYGELVKLKEANFKKLYNKYIADLYQAEQRELEGHIIESLVKEAAKAAGKSEEEYMRGVAGEPTVTDAEIQEFYDKQVKQSGQPFEAVADRIRQFLVGSKQRDAMKAAIDKIKADNGVKLSLPEPETSKASFDLAGRPFKGNPNAKITIVEFSDFQCPYCSRAIAPIKDVLAAMPNDVKVYFLHFPLNFHEKAMPAAIASQCANAQGKFWEFHDKIFEQQNALSPELFASTAKELGLDEGKFNACLTDPATKAFVEADMKQGEVGGVEGTPSFFINGVPSQSGPPTVEMLKAKLATL